MKKLIKKAYAFSVVWASFFAIVMPAVIRADVASPQAGITPEIPAVSRYMRVTAYSSSPDETDDTPFITANGTHVRDGIVATNILPFGTKIMIPALFGNKIFTVQDRMNRRIKNTVDIWMTSKTAALRFGVSRAEIVLVTGGAISQK